MRKESTSSSRLEEELDHDERPIYVIILSAFLKLALCIYDVVTYLPFKFIIEPEKQVEHSKQIKVGSLDQFPIGA